jgi:hypothetical protein
MPDDSSTAVRYAVKRTRELFTPLDIRFLIHSSSWLAARKAQGPGFDELRRLRPYYRGTRQLSAIAVFLVLLSLLLPILVPFVGMDGFVTLLILYVLLIIAVTIASILIESVTDAVFAIKFESGCSLLEAIRTFLRYFRADASYMIEYMIIKQVVDTILMTLVMALYLPVALVAIAMLQSLIAAISAGQRDVMGVAMPWLVVILAFLVLAVLATALLSAPMSAFYGYYTEESVRAMGLLEGQTGGE